MLFKNKSLAGFLCAFFFQCCSSEKGFASQRTNSLLCSHSATSSENLCSTLGEVDQKNKDKLERFQRSLVKVILALVRSIPEKRFLKSDFVLFSLSDG